MGSGGLVSGRKGNLKGSIAETRAVGLLSSLVEISKPGWLLDVKRAPLWLDRRGVDVIVLTDVGELYLQIKSSQAGAKKFRKKKRSLMVETVVIGPDDLDNEVKQRLVEAIQHMRRYLLSV